MKGKLAFQDDLVIELVPFRERRKLWAWELGDRTKVKAVDYDTNEIRNPHKKSYNGERNGWPCQEVSARHFPHLSFLLLLRKVE